MALGRGGSGSRWGSDIPIELHSNKTSNVFSNRIASSCGESRSHNSHSSAWLPSDITMVASNTITATDKASNYIRTSAQNYISRSAIIHGPKNLITNGRSVIRSGVIIHAEYEDVSINIGRYVRLEEGVVITPCLVPKSSDPLLLPSSLNNTGNNNNNDDEIVDGKYNTNENNKTQQSSSSSSLTKNARAVSIHIGSHTYIGKNTHIAGSISIGSCCYIGSNCILSSRSKVHDCCIIENETVIPIDMVIPPFSRVCGNPGRIVGMLPECTGGEFVEARVCDYLDFVAGIGT